MSLFDGVVAAAVTPRRPNSYEANLGAFLEVVDFLCGFPLDGLVVLGTTGDMVHFDVPERVKILEFAHKRSTLPIFAGVTHSTLDGTVELAQHAVVIGCAGLAVMPPYYFRYDQPEIDTFYREFARRVGLTVPIFLYNIPAFTSEVHTETITRLVQEGVVAGVKDSSGDRAQLDALIALRESKPYHLFAGDDRLLFEAKQRPGVGAISGIACALPELITGVSNAVRTSNDEKARTLDRLLQQFCDWYDEFPNAIAVKEALAARTRIPMPSATPLSFQRQQRLEEFRAWFTKWLPEMQKACTAE
ncbi:MAG: dihydrodipicolinate synthase family protein [Bryobacterales bacterium]|nr:dihydrodipicolinate synthase family protein [Bryobacterales bacterium]